MTTRSVGVLLVTYNLIQRIYSAAMRGCGPLSSSLGKDRGTETQRGGKMVELATDASLSRGEGVDSTHRGRPAGRPGSGARTQVAGCAVAPGGALAGAGQGAGGHRR